MQHANLPTQMLDHCPLHCGNSRFHRHVRLIDGHYPSTLSKYAVVQAVHMCIGMHAGICMHACMHGFMYPEKKCSNAVM